MSKLKKSADEAFAKILEFAADESVGEKTRLDLYKWICEMYYGKPGSGRAPEGGGIIRTKFEGELDKWSN